MATLKALTLPEIIANILDNFEDGQPRSPASLVSCAQVNHPWFDQATSILWSQNIDYSNGFPNDKLFSALFKMPQNRQPIYSVKIRYMDDNYFRDISVNSREHYHHCFAILEFPRLREAVIRMPSTLSNEQNRLQYLAPNLNSLKITEPYMICDGSNYITGGFMLQVQVSNSLSFSSPQ